MSLPQFKLLLPRTLEEALGLLTKHTDKIRVLAGGTDLIPSMQQKLFDPEYVLDLRRVANLRGIRETESAVTIGAIREHVIHGASGGPLFWCFIRCTNGVAQRVARCLRERPTDSHASIAA